MNIEVERLKRESTAMMEYLKKLERDEKELYIQNQILAREALTNGYTIESVLKSQSKQGPPKRRKASVANKQDKNGNNTGGN